MLRKAITMLPKGIMKIIGNLLHRQISIIYL